eukprot:36795_1
MTRKSANINESDVINNTTTHSQYEQLIVNDNESSDDGYAVPSNDISNDNNNPHEFQTDINNNYQCNFGCHFDKQTAADIIKAHKARKKLFYALIFCILFMFVELIGGYIAHSIALMSDALHLLSDCGGLIISLISLWITQKNATNKLTFGYHRAEILGALFSVFLIWFLTFWLVYEAINRIFNPEDVNGEIMFIIACIGIVVNIVMSGILHQGHDHHHHHNHNHSHSHFSEDAHIDNNQMGIMNENENHTSLNVRSAFIHALGDLLQSIGVLIASILIWYDNNRYRIADPICTLIFSIIVVFTTFNLMRDILSVLMESVPININYNDITSELCELTDVEQIHDLHVWNISLGKPCLSVHLLLKSTTLDSNGKIITACADSILRNAENILRNKFNIQHSTIQIEWQHDDNSRISCPDYCNINHNSNGLLCIS